MKKYTLQECIDNDIVIHCRTEEEANEYCKAMHELGRKWCDIGTYIDDNGWCMWGQETCYIPGENCRSGVECSRMQNLEIITFEQLDLGSTRNNATKYDISEYAGGWIVNGRYVIWKYGGVICDTEKGEDIPQDIFELRDSLMNGPVQPTEDFDTIRINPKPKKFMKVVGYRHKDTICYQCMECGAVRIKGTPTLRTKLEVEPQICNCQKEKE